MESWRHKNCTLVLRIRTPFAPEVGDLFAVRNPDVLHLGGVFEEPAALRQFRIEPIDDSALVRPHLLQVASGHRLRGRNHAFVSVTPDAIDVVVFREWFQKLGSVACHDVDGAAGKIARVKKLVEVAGNQRIFLRRHGNHRVAHRQQRKCERQEP